LFAWNAGYRWRYEPFVDYVTGLTIGKAYYAQTIFSGIPAIIVARVKSIAINYAMFVNRFATNAVKTAQINIWWYEEIARTDPVQRNSDPSHAYISGVNELSQ
jgi:hypothetical protein